MAAFNTLYKIFVWKLTRIVYNKTPMWLRLKKCRLFYFICVIGNLIYIPMILYERV